MWKQHSAHAILYDIHYPCWNVNCPCVHRHFTLPPEPKLSMLTVNLLKLRTRLNLCGPMWVMKDQRPTQATLLMWVVLHIFLSLVHAKAVVRVCTFLSFSILRLRQIAFRFNRCRDWMLMNPIPVQNELFHPLIVHGTIADTQITSSLFSHREYCVDIAQYLINKTFI